MEISMAGAVVMILFAVIIPAIMSYVNHAREASDRQTLTVLNEALNAYKTQGGDLDALTLGAPFDNIITKLKTPVDWLGEQVQFLNSGTDYVAASLDAFGEGSGYSFYRYNTYRLGTAEGKLTTEKYNSPEKFVAVARYQDRYAFSMDGSLWYEGRLPLAPNTSTFNISFEGGKFFVTWANSQYCYSTDGINWSIGTFPLTTGWIDVEYGNGVLVVAVSSCRACEWPTPPTASIGALLLCRNRAITL